MFWKYLHAHHVIFITEFVLQFGYFFFEHLISCGLSERGTIEGTVELFKRQGEENTGFGFVWSPFSAGGAIITQIITDSPADRSEGRMQVRDRISAINGTNIMCQNSSAIEALILASGLSIVLTIQGTIFLVHT